jgi:hypothetical protein
MKNILFINGFSAADNQLAQVAFNSGAQIEIIDVMTQDNPFKPYVRATPALFIFRDDMQGEFLSKPGVDIMAIIEAALLEQQDIEEDIVHGQQNHRLDTHIKRKQNEAVDALTTELLEGGIL